MLGKLFGCKRPFFNPFIWSDIRSVGNYKGINDIKRNQNVVVSLTAREQDFETLPITLYSIITQSMLPDEIVLWVSEEYDNLSALPYEITQFVKNGLKICFIKDLKSYNNSIYAFENYKNSVIVTANAQFYYEKEWLKRLYTSYIINPKDIQVHLAKSVISNKDEILSFNNWQINSSESAEYCNFPVTDGGVLYPPNCFSQEVLRKDVFLKYIPENSDFWLWVMALVHKRKIRVVKNHYHSIKCFNCLEDTAQEGFIDDNSANRLLKLYSQNVFQQLNL